MLQLEGELTLVTGLQPECPGLILSRAGFVFAKVSKPLLHWVLGFLSLGVKLLGQNQISVGLFVYQTMSHQFCWFTDMGVVKVNSKSLCNIRFRLMQSS